MRNRTSISLLAAVALLSACAGDKKDGNGGGTVIAAMAADPSSLFPLLVNEETGAAVTTVLFDKLAEIDEHLSILGDAGFKPRLAKSWDWSSDSLRVTFHLDPAARFHDGTPVTAGDVKYTFTVAKDTMLGSPFTSLIANIDSVTVADSLTPTFWFHRRSPSQFYDAVYQLPPVPEHVYGKVPVADLKTSDVTRNPVGTGRFRFVKWEPGVRIEVVADTANYRGRAKLDRVIFMLAQSPTSAAAGLMAGQVDFYSNFPIDQVDRLDSSSVIRALPYQQNGYAYLGMNPHARKAKGPHPILGDIAVRRALSMALDRRSMLTNVFKTSGRLAYGPFPTGAALADTTLPSPPYDTAAAAAALDAAGWKRGPNGTRMKAGRPLALEIMVPNVSLPRMRYAELIQDQLNRAGFQVEIAAIAPQVWGPRQQSGDYDLTLLAQTTDPTVPGIQQWWGNPQTTGTTNFLGYTSPVVDRELEAATKASDAATLQRHTVAAFRQIMEDVPAVWLYTSSYIAAANKRIEVAPFRLDGWWVNLADWSIPADKRIDRDRIGLRPATP
jgi:peptide/nickel transport system substrate-binding protein